MVTDKTEEIMETKKTTLSLNAQELQVLDEALTKYFISMADKSTTYANYTARISGHGPDIYEENAFTALDVQMRIFAAERRIGTRKPVTE